MNQNIKYILLALIAAGHYSVLAQRLVVGRVLDKDTKQPIYEAKVTIHGTNSITLTLNPN